jgi:hypothetical protein
LFADNAPGCGDNLFLALDERALFAAAASLSSLLGLPEIAVKWTDL